MSEDGKCINGESDFVKRIYKELITNESLNFIEEVLNVIVSPCKRGVLDLEVEVKKLMVIFTKYNDLFELKGEISKGPLLVKPVVTIEFCKNFDSKRGCLLKEACPKLHVCRHFVKGKCTFGTKCKKPHHFNDKHTHNLLEKHYLNGLTDKQLKDFLCRNVQFALEDITTSNQLPKTLEICKYYNVAIGCTRGDSCPYLHVCRFYAEEDGCKFRGRCIRRHDLENSHAQALLERYKLSSDSIFSYLKQKVAVSSPKGSRNEPARSLSLSGLETDNEWDTIGLSKPRSLSLDTDHLKIVPKTDVKPKYQPRTSPDPQIPFSNEMCLHPLFVKGSVCRGACPKVHYSKPFLWQMKFKKPKNCYEWIDFEDKENMEIENVYCSDIGRTNCEVKIGEIYFTLDFVKMVAAILNSFDVKDRHPKESHKRGRLDHKSCINGE